jgi:hypothetical protein
MKSFSDKKNISIFLGSKLEASVVAVNADINYTY